MDPSNYFTEEGAFTLPPRVLEEGLMFVFTHTEREVNPLCALLPSSFRFRLDPGPTILKMVELNWLDNLPEGESRRAMKPAEVTLHLQKLMKSGDGATSGCAGGAMTQRVSSLAGRSDGGPGEDGHEANSRARRRLLDDNLITDAQEQGALYSDLASGPSQKAERYCASDCDGEGADVKRLRSRRKPRRPCRACSTWG